MLPKLAEASPFERYQAIGIAGVPKGDDIVQYVRKMRGHDADEDEWERAYERANDMPASSRKRA